MAANTGMNAGSNVDPGEIEKFSAWADRWWSVDGELATLHKINPIRMDFISRHCPLEGLDVLDVGCGGGILSEAMARRGAKVKGVDLAEQSLNVARAHAARSGLEIDYELVSAEDLAQREEGRYDAVACMELLEHVPNPSSVALSLGRLVKPGGHVFMSTINRNLKSFLQAIVAAEYALRMLKPGTHDFAKFIRPSEMSAMARNAGLRVVEISGFGYNFLTDRFHPTRSVDVNYFMACVKPERTRADASTGPSTDASTGASTGASASTSNSSPSSPQDARDARETREAPEAGAGSDDAKEARENR